MKDTIKKHRTAAAKAGIAGTAGVVLAACAGCCVPLVTPLLVWLGLSGLGMATTGWYLELAVVCAIGLGAILLLRRRKAMDRSPSCRIDGSCGCGSSYKN